MVVPMYGGSARFDPSEVKIVFVSVIGGEASCANALAPKIGPLGLSPRKIGQQIAEETQDWKGIQILVKLTIQNLEARIDVVPNTNCLIMKELGLNGRDDVLKKQISGVKHIGNLTLAQVVDIARQVRSQSGARKLEGTVREVLEQCSNSCVTVDGQNPKDLAVKIRAGEVLVPDN